MDRQRGLPWWLQALTPILIALSGCEPESTGALGTIERDRITLPATVAERIAEIPVREGETVAAGTVLVAFENERTRARLDVAQAELDRSKSALEEARRGPRVESIAQARAELRRPESIALNARREFERVSRLVEQRLLSPAELDSALAAASAADADVAARRSALELLQNGTRAEQLAQAEATAAKARAELASITVDLERTRVVAPRAGIVDSLPFEVGDQVAVQTTVATLLVGETPYARVYVPQPLRTAVSVGDAASVRVQGSERQYAGRVRAIRNEPNFTPYYALSGNDAARLSYLAEIELGVDAIELPVGIPVRAEFLQTTPP